MDLWISGMKVVSIVASGAFGMLGLLTKYKEGDRMTRWGRIALGGIVFSAVLSLSLQLLQTAKETAKQQAEAARSAIEARKAEEAARATSKQLKDILTTAQTTSDQQSKNLAEAQVITGKMDTSLKTQGDVLAGNREILSGVGEGARRDVRNTIGILRTIWDESNRIEAKQMTIAITYTFSREVNKPPPGLFENGETLSIRAVSKNSAGSLRYPLNRWSSRHLLDSRELVLNAKEQKITRQEHFSVDGISYEQTSYFSGFEGDIKKFFVMTNWNGALLEVHLTKQDPSLIAKLKASLDWKPEHASDLEDLKREYDVAADLEEYDYRVTPLPIHARLVVYVRERPIARSDAVLVSVWEHDEDVRGLVVAKFKIAKVGDRTFPEFKPSLESGEKSTDDVARLRR